MPICQTHKIEMDVVSDCSTCHGSGIVEDDYDFGAPPHSFVKCWRCGGSGVSPWLDCAFCLEENRDE